MQTFWLSFQYTYTKCISSPFSTGNSVKMLVARQLVDQSGHKRREPSVFAAGINNGHVAASTNATDKVSL
jgi:hypothetical protein